MKRNTSSIPLFLLDWKRALIVFPAIFLYCGFLPILKLCGVVSMNWFWTFAPVWMPFIGYWLIVGMVSYAVLITEISFLIMPDEDVFEKFRVDKEEKKDV